VCDCRGMNKKTKSKKVLPPLPFLGLEDYDNSNRESVLNDFKGEWQAEPSCVDRFEVLVAYQSVGDYGCDSSAWFLLREKSTGRLFEACGSHCSCYGFEGQFEPEQTTVTYLKSDKFSFGLGGYDSTYNHRGAPTHVDTVRAWIKANL
jgi:hypothetical protein